mgnify:FL=1
MWREGTENPLFCIRIIIGHFFVWPKTFENRYPHTTTHTMAARVSTACKSIGDFLQNTHMNALCKAKKPIAILALVANVFLPGVGTFIACVTCDKAMDGLICLAMMWLMCFVFLVGWVWSIVHGVQLVMRATS